MSEEMLSSLRQKIKQLIADAYMTLPGTRGAKHGEDYPKEPRVRTKVPKAHAKGKRWKWDRLITMTDRGFRRNGALTKG